MLDVDRIRPIVLLRDMGENMLEKIAEKAKMASVKSGQYIFKEGDVAENFYSVVEGRIILELTPSSHTTYKLKYVFPAQSFGISGLVDSQEKLCVSHAKAVENSKLVVWKAADLEELFQSNYRLGVIFTKRIARVLKARLQATNAILAANT